MPNKNTPSDSYKFTIGLLYPGILGSLIYSIMHSLSIHSFQDNKGSYFLISLILIVFVLDYLYTTTEKSNKRYSISKAILDAFIVASLFIAINHILKNIYLTEDIGALRIVFYALSFAKLLALLWECIDPKSKNLPKVTYSGFMLICFIFGVIYSDFTVLIIILLIDIPISFCFEKIEKPDFGRNFNT